MDDNCGGQARNDDMSEGDVYFIETDSSAHGTGKRPAECSQVREASFENYRGREQPPKSQWDEGVCQ